MHSLSSVWLFLLCAACDGEYRRMAIANGTCVSFCNQPKAQFGCIRRVTPFCGWRHLPTSRESKAHFGLQAPWVRPWDNRGKCYMDGKRIQCWSNASQHTHLSIYDRLSRFDTILACDGQTDGRPAYSYNVRSKTDVR